jgi:GSH-dependent disulfide-bond oxidoreductase
MLKFYFNGAPNPTKVALFLEEAGLPYEPVAVDTRKGDQFKPEFLKVNPNAKVPAIDDDGVFVFDSNAILLYLAEKTGKFLPAGTPANRAQLLSWLMFVATGLGPYSGQAVHFKHFAPKELEYAHNRYQFEAHRHYKILDDHLANSRYWSETPTASSTWRCGAGRAWRRSSSATTPSRNMPTSNGCSTRSPRGRRRHGRSR